MIQVRPAVSDTDRNWLRTVWVEDWGGDSMVTRGRVHHLRDLPGLIAWQGDERVGAATYCLEEGACELMSLNALSQGQGVGTLLLTAVEEAARQAGCSRVWLITSNDNLDAVRFYQRRGYRLVAVYPGAVDEARKVKPTIPLVGFHGIPLHDDWELEKRLATASGR